MDFIERSIISIFNKKVLPNKVLILLGARRVGKTAFIKNYLSVIPKSDYLQLNGEDIDDANLLKERSVSNYSRLLANTKLLVIDEAQNILNIGLILKTPFVPTETNKLYFFCQLTVRPICLINQKPMILLQLFLFHR